MRSIRYQTIADDLRGRLQGQEFASARVLPSESDLSSQYSASRVTVRRALELLRSEGLIESKQGFGWLVAAEPLQQQLSHLGTLDAQLAAAGIRSDRKILSFGFVAAPEHVAAVLAELVSEADAELLGVPIGSPVLVAERITRSQDGVAVLMSEHVFPAHRTRFAVELPVGLAADGGSLNPAGMRLLD